MKLGTQVGLGLGHIVLDGNRALPPLKRHSSPNSRPMDVRCGQRAGRIKMSLGMEVGLIPGDFVIDGDAALPRQIGGTAPNFGPCLLWPNGRPSQLLLSSCFQRSR